MYAVFACYTMLAVREDHALYGAVLLTVRVNSMKKLLLQKLKQFAGGCIPGLVLNPEVTPSFNPL